MASLSHTWNRNLPKGQRAIGYFPRRYGVGFWEAAPQIAQPALVRIGGAVARQLQVPVAHFAELKRRELVADMHCVTGWTAQGLRWGGVSFRTFYESVIVPEAGPDPGVTHILLEGADGELTAVLLEDALSDDVLLADQLGGTALDSDHGAPLRFVSPKQYAYKSTKYLCGIELCTREPVDGHRKAGIRFLRRLVKQHPRARVSQQERHRYLPAWAVRRIYRMFFRSWAWLYRKRHRS
jgi:DMSO/TMAO reductase YedYZ molybdopterin-dependent catalytic subunit